MTDKITQPETMTGDQRRQIKQFFENLSSSKNVDALLKTLNPSKEEAQGIVEKFDLIKKEVTKFTTALIKKYAVIDQRFGPALIEFDLTVPTDYNHDTIIDDQKKKLKKLKNTYYYNDDLTSKNYANATNKLVPGKTYKVKIFPILENVTSEDCMTFLKKQRAILVGGQGVLLANDLRGDEFPVGKWTVSFDEKEALWKDSDGDRRVPNVYRFSDGDRGFDLGYFEFDWVSDSCLLCFCDK